MAKQIYSCTECGRLDETVTRLERICDKCYDQFETIIEFYNPNYD